MKSSSQKSIKIPCSRCKNIEYTRFYKNAQLCGLCYGRDLNKKTVKVTCFHCKKKLKCPYKGPCCANCYSKYFNTLYREAIYKRNKERSYTLINRFNQGKSEATRRKIKWLLDIQTYQNLISKPCHYCNLLIASTGVGLDRINNDKSIGYTVDNVLPCCGDCNKIRGDRLTVEEMEVAMKAILLFRERT